MNALLHILSWVAVIALGAASIAAAGSIIISALWRCPYCRGWHNATEEEQQCQREHETERHHEITNRN